MAVDYYESSSNNNNHYLLEESFPLHLNTHSSPSTQRPHLRLYERQQSNPLQQVQSPQRQSPQSPSQGNLTDSFSCWSPISNGGEEDPNLKWSSGYESWMQGSSSENSTTSSTDDYECDVFALPSNQTSQTPYNQWSTPQIQPIPSTNDENLFSQISRLNLQDQRVKNEYFPHNTHLNNSLRKWSHESGEDKSVKSAPVPRNNYYAPYIQQSNVHQNVPQFIPTTEKWSTAESSSSTRAMSGDLMKNSSTNYQDPCFRARQIFAQLNPMPARRQGLAMSCDEAEIQWYHHLLELQQGVYDQIYNKVLSGELKKKQSAKQQSSQSFAPAASTSQIESTIIKQSNQPSPSSETPSPPSASIDLALKLEQCTTQYRQLEKERKKTEAELAKHNLGMKISSANNLHVPRLPPAPSHIDRLVVDFFREHARVITLICRMEQLRGSTFGQNLHAVMQDWLNAIRFLQQRRLSERNAILSHLSGDLGFYDAERELVNQKEALVMLIKATVRARAANWCALIQTLGTEGPVQDMQLARIQSLEFRCEPPEIQARPLKPANK